MAKREVVNRGWLLHAQSSKKLKGQWKTASSLGMHLSAKYSGARLPTMYAITRPFWQFPTHLAMWSDRFPFGNTFVLRSTRV